MRKLTTLALAALLASRAYGQAGTKPGDKKPDASPPQLKAPERGFLPKPPQAPMEDGRERSYSTLEKQGWVYLLDGRIPKDPKASDAFGLWRLRSGDPKRNLWSMIEENGERVLRNTVGKDAHGTDLISKQRFWDFDLHVEFRVPASSNSGVYLRGRYEIQIDSFGADKQLKPAANNLGAVYNVREPLTNASRGPGQWQVLDLTIRGFRILNVRLNGETIQTTVELPEDKKPGTGSQLTAEDGESNDPDSPGPIFLQGDHGSIDFRNVRVRPLRAAVPRMTPDRDRVIDLKNDTVTPPGVPEPKKSK
jgi:hypothetical protein